MIDIKGLKKSFGGNVTLHPVCTPQCCDNFKSLTAFEVL